MSEAVTEPDEKPPWVAPSFEERVWKTLSNVDVTPYLQVKNKFSYLPWADCWMLLMAHFPESTFEFDDPKMYENQTGEQWVTVRVIQGEDTMVRRWWLPYMDYNNKPVSNPTSLQINNTRMRTLVKCVAMCGLGVEVYSGEDVPDKGQDSEAVSSVKSTSVRADIIEEMALTDEDWATVSEWVEKLQEAMPTAELIDYDALEPLYGAVAKLGELAIPISHKLTSWQRTALRKIRDRKNQQ